MRAGVTLCHQANISHIGGSKVTAGVNINQMIALFVSAAANIVHLHHALVHNNDSLFRIDANRAHVTAKGASLSQNFGLSHLYLGNTYSIDNLDFVNLMITAHKAQDEALFALESHCLHGFFYRQVQIFAHSLDGFTVGSQHLFYGLGFFSLSLD